ncbi:TnsA endonuclease N-terminal domain-containing protein, partial [Vibrio mexicanus]|uniref:TnsA endonuclease N-terminal domain-containing protein n=1 Tax=Vibrio mexicanus TaxID=1004326 RepID=UPI00063C293D
MYDQTKKSSAVHNICKFMSLKNDSVIRTMSILEFDFCFHAEYNPKVARYESQPFGFEYLFNGRTCRYTPDFQLFNDSDNGTLVEVKHSSQTTKEDFRVRFAEKQRVAKKDHQKKLILVTEKQIRAGFFLSNLKLLHGYSGLRT